MLIGYARVSTPEQSLNLQIDALVRHGVPEDKIFTDVKSAVAKKRPGFDKMWKHLRPGDVIVVWRLDRFARSMIDLLTRTQELERMGVGFRSLNESLDTTTAGGKLIFHIMGALAEFERNLTIERTKAGLRAAKERGAHIGRKPKLTDALKVRVMELYASGWSISGIARELDVSRPVIRKFLDSLAET